MLKTKERIIPISDLQVETESVIHNAQQQPLVITDKGRPTAYIVSVDMFDALMEQLTELENSELIAGIEMGKQQFARGDFVNLQQATELATQAWRKLEEEN